MNILILGAAGQIGQLLTDELLARTEYNLVLYAKNADRRLSGSNPERIKIITGDFKDTKTLLKAMENIDIVYINDMGDDQSTQSIIEAMDKHKIKRVIAASVLGIYDEVPGAFGRWNKMMVGSGQRMQKQIKSAQKLEESDLDYTLLRLTWLYNQQGNNKYMLVPKGEPFKETQISRQAVAQAITDIITSLDDKYIRQSFGIGEPGTQWDKPSFY
ncbi:NAD(P)H-binding protein [Mucilaginibacter angelicae]|uniref:NAD(P)H-binding protein n=1 Tax=Mucilaginibacter angelicae TaxID=869718 RepID=A0ABV6LF94_9SPHI